MKQEFPRFLRPAPGDLIWLIAINWLINDGVHKWIFGGLSGPLGEGTTALPLTCLLPAAGAVGRVGTGTVGRVGTGASTVGAVGPLRGGDGPLETAYGGLIGVDIGTGTVAFDGGLV